MKSKTGEPEWRIRCLHEGCSRMFSPKTSTSPLAYHYRTEHRSVYQQMTNGSKSKGKQVERGLSEVGLIQTKMNTLSIQIPSKDKVIFKCLEWIIEDMQPFSIMDSPSFRALLTLYNSRAPLPCAATARSKMVSYRSDLSTRVDHLVQTTMLSGSITIDGWTSQSNKPFLSVTLHWLTENFKFLECVLDMVPFPYPHDGGRIGQAVRKFLF